MTENKNFSFSKLAVIIPVHEDTETASLMLENAIKSVPSGIDIFIVLKESAIGIKVVDPESKVKQTFLKSVESDFCSMVNYAVSLLNPEYEWISILEYDDSFNSHIFEANAEKYIKANEDISVFLPLSYLINATDNSFIGFVNEMALAMPKDQRIGELDEEFLRQVFNINLTGAIIKRDVWEDLRGSIKIYFWYEWALRVMRKGAKVFTIPKVMYNHLLMREGSIFAEYQKTVTGKENNYWLNVAKNSSKLDEDKTVYAYNSKSGK